MDQTKSDEQKAEREERKEILKPALAKIQTDNLGTEPLIELVQDMSTAFSFQTNIPNPTKPVKPEVVSNQPTMTQKVAGVIIATSQPFKTARLAKRISSPVQFREIHQIHSIATEEGTFVNESKTGVDIDHVFPGE